MTLIYRFKKEKLANGRYAARPRILVVLQGEHASIEVPALIDSGCDVTVIPESIAKALGLDMSGEKDKLYAYRESNEVIQSKATFTFVGRVQRQSVTLNQVPVLIALAKDAAEEEHDITLGVEGIFDAFDITFKKSQNKISLQKATRSLQLKS